MLICSIFSGSMKSDVMMFRSRERGFPVVAHGFAAYVPSDCSRGTRPSPSSGQAPHRRESSPDCGTCRQGRTHRRQNPPFPARWKGRERSTGSRMASSLGRLEVITLRRLDGPNPGPPCSHSRSDKELGGGDIRDPLLHQADSGLDDEVITRAPAPAPPYTILMDATSLSAGERSCRAFSPRRQGTPKFRTAA